MIIGGFLFLMIGIGIVIGSGLALQIPPINIFAIGILLVVAGVLLMSLGEWSDGG